MKIRIIDTTHDKQNEGLIGESPPLGLAGTEAIPPSTWAKQVIKQNSWQGCQFPLEQLEMLLEKIPYSILEKERNMVRWTIDEQDLEVDWSIILAVLGRDFLILNPEAKKFALTLE